MILDNPIESLSPMELRQLKIAITRTFTVKAGEDADNDDYNSKWFDIYNNFVRYVYVNRFTLYQQYRFPENTTFEDWALRLIELEFAKKMRAS